jgi:hypothetical protein
MKWLASLYLSVIAISFTGCDCSKKSWDCPGFDSPELSGWFSYGNTNLLVFQNSTGQRDTIHLNHLETTAPYSTSGNRRFCSAVRQLESTDRMPNGDVKMAVRLTKSENSGYFTNSALITLHNYMPVMVQNATGNSLGSIRFNNSASMNVQYLPVINLGGRSFNDAVVASRDTGTDKSAGIYKIYIAKNQGVVGYEELPARSLFVLQ